MLNFKNYISRCFLFTLVFLTHHFIFAEYPLFDASHFAWRTGQVIAISEPFADPSTFIFEAGTGSRFGHVGLVVVEREGVFVYQESPPEANRVSIEKFLEGATDPKLKKVYATVLEYSDGLSESETAKLVASAKEIVAKKIPYNYTMITSEPADTSMNCSEFIYNIFKNAGLKAVGEFAKFSTMNVHAFADQLLKIAQIPPNFDGTAITPVSIVNSKNLRVLTSNLPVEKIVSEFDILQAWIENGAFENLINLIDLPKETSQKFSQVANKNPYRPYPAEWRSPSTETPLSEVPSPAKKCEKSI